MNMNEYGGRWQREESWRKADENKADTDKRRRPTKPMFKFLKNTSTELEVYNMYLKYATSNLMILGIY